MDKPDSDLDLTKKTREFLDVFRKGEEFTHEVLKENERPDFPWSLASALVCCAVIRHRNTEVSAL